MMLGDGIGSSQHGRKTGLDLPNYVIYLFFSINNQTFMNPCRKPETSLAHRRSQSFFLVRQSFIYLFDAVTVLAINI
jgi:hypothetical protein